MSGDSDSTVALKVLAILGWSLLLCVNIIAIIVCLRLRHGGIVTGFSFEVEL
jgi:hypothetical protein